jgi:hypothetical protein
MSLSAEIIDHQVRGLAAQQRLALEAALGGSLDEQKAVSVAFVALCMKEMLQLSMEEAIRGLTEGSDDFGVDGMGIGEVDHGAFSVTLFQGKYHHSNLDGTRRFPQEGVEKALQAVRLLFVPQAPLRVNRRLAAKLAVVHARLLDGYLPRVSFLLCSNGQRWKSPEVQQLIDRERHDGSVRFEHVDHERLVKLQLQHTLIEETLQLVGTSHVREGNYSRTLVGTIAASELARLVLLHDEPLFASNIRGYLGTYGNEVNDDIRETLQDAERRKDLYELNNGISFACDYFEYNLLQPADHRVRVENLRLINGGQTSRIIASLLSSTPLLWRPSSNDEPQLLVRLVQVGRHPRSEELLRSMTIANNKQTSVDLVDLHSNDEVHQHLEESIRLLGYRYRRHRSSRAQGERELSIGAAAEAVLSIWRREPHRARFLSAEYFNSVHHKIFSRSLNGAQVVAAVLLFRIAEKKARLLDTPLLVHHAAGFLAMLMGQRLLATLEIELAGLDHRCFVAAEVLIETEADRYFDEAVAQLAAAVERYRAAPLDTHRLAELFQRSSLLEYLEPAARS